MKLFKELKYNNVSLHTSVINSLSELLSVNDVPNRERVEMSTRLSSHKTDEIFNLVQIEEFAKKLGYETIIEFKKLPEVKETKFLVVVGTRWLPVLLVTPSEWSDRVLSADTVRNLFDNWLAEHKSGELQKAIGSACSPFILISERENFNPDVFKIYDWSKAPKIMPV